MAAGAVVYKFTHCTYGCIADGTAVTLKDDGNYPFFELPTDALEAQETARGTE